MTTRATEGRFFYFVRPSLSKWEVTFGERGSCFLYDSREEAEQVAHGAAKLHWESRAAPSGVKLELPGMAVAVVGTYGPSTRQAPAGAAI